MKPVFLARIAQSSGVSLLALTLAAGQAQAQDTAPPADPAAPQVDDAVGDGDAIVVTGSRIARPEEDSPNPVTSVGATNIQQSGLTNLTDVLVQNPALIGSTTTADAGGSTASFGGVGINLLNLRNLGSDRTLVLVNGRRHIAGISGSSAVDINTIPVALIDRIDVLTGGVSAIYGADGVSGVVNFVLKRKFEGIDARAQSGISSRRDSQNYYASLTAGKNFADDRGNVAVSYEYNRDELVPGSARISGQAGRNCGLVRDPGDFPDDPNRPDRIVTCDVRYADSSTNGAVDVDIDFSPDFQGNGLPYDLGINLPQSGGLVQGGSSTPTAGYQGDLAPRTEKHNVNLLASFEFSDALRLFAEGKYVQTKSFSNSQPSFDFFSTIQADNPFIPLAIRNAIVPGTYSANLSDYSTVGKTTTWKVDGNWAPIADINFRGTWSQAVRAPNITELFAPQNGTFSFIDDPCDPVNIPEGSQFRQANCTALLTGLGINPATFSPTSDPRATVSLPGRSGGNPDLAEETARTWTAGVIVKPRFIPRLTLTFDWYDIKLNNAISTAAAQDLVDLCVDQPTLDNQFCANVGRDPATGFVNDYLVGPANVAQFATSGADFTINYTVPTETMGTFNLRLAGGYLDKLTFVPTPGADVDVDTEESYAPRWNGTLDLTWAMDNVTINYGLNYFSKTRRYTTEQITANPDLVEAQYVYFRPRVEHDVQLSLKTDDQRFTFYTGVNNVFDRQPDLGQLNYPSSFRGRFFYAGVRVGLGAIPGL